MNIEAADQKVLEKFGFKANSQGKGSSLWQGEMTEIVEDVGQAVWWIPSDAILHGPNVHCLEGEIHPPKDLYLSCMVPFLIVEVGPATRILLNKLLISNIVSTVSCRTFHQHF